MARLLPTFFGAAVLVSASPAAADCGDGVLDPGEACDDLNLEAGDGCGATCQIEAGWSCVDASFALDFSEVIADGIEDAGPDWSLWPGGLTVTQSQNSDPAIYVSGLPAPGVTITFELTVTTAFDDDFIGWVVGYGLGEFGAEEADWLLFDWKQVDQDSGGYFAAQGLAVSRIEEPLSSAWDLWAHEASVVELARANTLGATGWADYATYTIELAYDLSRIQVWVNGVLEFDLDGRWPAGNFGFYNFSQQEIQYTLVAPVEQSVCGQLDTDEDGVGDPVELALGMDPESPDSDGDGLDDLFELGDADNPQDTDGDGLIDPIDTDDDGDGCPTAEEDGNSNGDLIDDDEDADGVPDYLDPDCASGDDDDSAADDDDSAADDDDSGTSTGPDDEEQPSARTPNCSCGATAAIGPERLPTGLALLLVALRRRRSPPADFRRASDRPRLRGT